MNSRYLNYDLVCLSHLRWDFVTQRPQHLLTRCAKSHRVYFVEEPVFDADKAFLHVSDRIDGVKVVVPHLTEALSDTVINTTIETLLTAYLAENSVSEYVLWYYTPMAIGFTRSLTPVAVIYDCMDELSAFDGANPELRKRESELFEHADLVFTGGQSLYEAKKNQHAHVHAFPSSVEVEHFEEARSISVDPEDQSTISHPRLGFFGVVDERFDLELLRGASRLRPDWHWIVLGPVVKIDPAALPQGPNIHYLGGKSYTDLPRYIAGWDVALLLFAHNDSTRFISPTKTPEYLAAGKPVVSTSIKDVVRPYGDMGLVRIADTPVDFVAACDAALHEDASDRVEKADVFLSTMSWDITWARMAALIDGVVTTHATRTEAISV